MADSTLIAVTVGAVAAGLPAVASASVAGRNQLRAIENEASIEARSKRTDLYVTALKLLRADDTTSTLVQNAIARGAGMPTTPAVDRAVSDVLYDLLLRGPDDVYQTAVIVLDTVRRSMVLYEAMGHKLLEETPKANMNDVLTVARAHPPIELRRAVGLLIQAMREDSALAAELAPTRRKRLHGPSVHWPRWLGG